MLRSLTLALMLGLAAPATAEQLTLTWEPRDAREARLLSGALAIQSARSHVRSGGRIEQWGRDNAAGLRQEGGGNWGLIRQDGEGHEATLDQSGGGNAHAIVQGGRGARADVAQTGRELGLTLQYGW